MIERLATAGYRQQDFPGLFEAALSTLESLGCRPSSNLRDLRAGNFSLHSPRPLVWLYRHATRQGRRCIPPASSKVHEELARLNNRCPLVLDLGCGFGAAALGLADEFAVLGVDASAHCIGYAKALAQRWQLAKKVSFVQCAAEEALAAAKDFGGEMEWILISFPTPFAAPADSRLCMETFTSGNSHLPEHVDSAEFMANVKMLEEARQCLLTHGGDGKLLIQSNVEDVAVTLRGLAEANGWEAAPEWQSRRQKQWQRHSGHRAAGAGWLKSSPLPRLARTETEAHYIAESLPIHRFALRLHPLLPPRLEFPALPSSECPVLDRRSSKRSSVVRRFVEAAALNISPYDTLPPELFTVEPHKAARAAESQQSPRFI
eukprot:g24374.t1